MRWIVAIAILIAAFVAFQFYWNYEQLQIQSELDSIADTGRPSARLSEYRYICFHDQFGTRGIELLEAAVKTGIPNQCGVRNSCCFKPLDSDIPALIGLVRGQEIECIKVYRFEIVVEPLRAACFDLSHLKVSRSVFDTNRDPRDGSPRTVGATYYKISEQRP
jgi:hypothetical protein